MRIGALRGIAIGLIFILIDIPLFIYDLLPDFVGLLMIFFCSVILTDRAGRFARAAVVSSMMLFIEAVNIFHLTESETALNFLGLAYLFLTVLLVITAADGISQFASTNGFSDIPRYCDITGHLFALSFVFSAFSIWFTSISLIFYALTLIISLFVIVMFIYFYSRVLVSAHSQNNNDFKEDTSPPEPDAVPAAAEPPKDI